MKTARTDVERDKRQISCPNSSFLGFSSTTLRFGDFFIYRTQYSRHSEIEYKGSFARCHGRVKSTISGPYYILAQVASTNMTFTFERWVTPEQVIEIIPTNHANKHILKFFEETEEYI